MIGIAQVISHNPPFGVIVQYRGAGQATTFPVRMGYEYADGLRVHQKPLPGIGSWGVVALPSTDLRSAIWLCAYYPSQLDALTTDGTVGAPFIENLAHWSGHWEYLDSNGISVTQFVDGSYFLASSGIALPTVYRHIVDASGSAQLIAFTRGDRIPNPPDPYNYIFDHASGTQVQVDVSGNVSVSGAAGASLTFNFGGATLKIDASGHATLNVPGSETFDVIQGGGAASDFAALVSKLVTWAGNHTHTGVVSGSSNTGTISTPVSSSTFASDVLKLSN